MFFFHQHVCSWNESTVYVQCKGSILSCHVHGITKNLIDAEKCVYFKQLFFFYFVRTHNRLPA